MTGSLVPGSVGDGCGGEGRFLRSSLLLADLVGAGAGGRCRAILAVGLWALCGRKWVCGWLKADRSLLWGGCNKEVNAGAGAGEENRGER